MGKRKKTRKKGGKSSAWVFVLVFALLATGIYYGVDWLGTPSSGQGRSFTVAGGETSPLLDPMRFHSRGAISAYAAAIRHPALMDKIYCYCRCERPPFNHKSLLSCFTDLHGAT